MNKETFLSKGIRAQKATIESIGSEVFIRPMSYAAAVAMGECTSVHDRALVTVIMGLVDEQNQPIFTMEDKDELAASMAYYTIQEIANAIMNISSLGSDKLVK